ncbi:hypothetical protein BDY19DRAFT_930540 [Irpex rosettiformis]|uniref:Uncharacterized protein n=1 Tax=Irpex rosettiformis TaxID=378272 RepID=A0ACB8UAM6_9APHY|nr:hypothetical protein BDY19DRAFT_930540 [Irpex rosettiformis]
MYSLLALECGALLAEAIVYGVYVLTFSVTIFVLLRRPSRTHSILATITILMFLLSTAHVGLLASTTLRHIVSGSIEVGLELRDKAYPEPSIQVVLECLNCILGDTIINWRAWVLWNRNRFVLTVPAVLLVAALGCNAGLCHAVFTEPVGEVLFSSAVVQRWGAGALSLTFSANIWGVSLVALRFRTYRKQVASSIPSHTDRSSGMSPTTVLLFLLETGTLYCCTLFVLAVTFITRSIGSYVVLNLLSQLTVSTKPDSPDLLFACLGKTHKSL